MRANPSSICFSIIIPTRNRAELCRRAIESVINQTHELLDIVIVTDGTDGAELKHYRSIAEAFGNCVRLIELPARANGHGPAFVRNTGVAHAKGHYVAFLDDDDEWCDTNHLARAADYLSLAGDTSDLYLTNQIGIFSNGERHSESLWLAGLAPKLDMAPDTSGHYRLSVEQLTLIDHFAHLNCSIYRREFLEKLGGLDESLRYEEDRDLYLRAIDEATSIVFFPGVIAWHHIPDRSRQDNVTTQTGAVQKLLIQNRVFDKAIATARHARIRAYARRAKGFCLRHLAAHLASANRFDDAFLFAREALAVSFSFKWLLYTLFMGAKSLTQTTRIHQG